MREVRSSTADGPYAQTIEIGGHTLQGDEGADKGGADAGPTPHEFLLAALATCTSMTVMAYARHKGLPLQHVDVRLRGRQEEGRFVIERTVRLEGALDEAQHARILEIAGRCPVARTLSNTITIVTV